MSNILRIFFEALFFSAKFSGKMRKFSKLLLAVLTFVSFAFFLFYKIQYDKLYNVLQVLEFFGDADKAAVDQRLETHLMSGILPTWQMVSADLFLYSSFCQGGGGCAKVAALAAAAGGGAGGNFSCRLWYEGTLRPVNGILTSVPLSPSGGDGPLKPYLLECESKFPSLKPFGITVSSGPNEGFVHVTSPAEVIEEDGEEPLLKKPVRKNGLLACVGPKGDHQDSTQELTEQVLLQNFFQVEHFLVYDGGVTDKFVSTLNKAAKEGFTVNVVPWNAPPMMGDESSLTLVKTDCHFRSKLRHDSYIFLKPGQVLVRRSKKEVFLEKTLKRICSKDSGAKMEIKVRRFCPEFPFVEGEVEHSINSIRMSSFDSGLSSEEPDPVLMYNLGSKMPVIKVNPEDFLIHDYSSCGGGIELDDNQDDIDNFIVDMSKQIQEKIGKFFPRVKS